jgi:hypothetical protein
VKVHQDQLTESEHRHPRSRAELARLGPVPPAVLVLQRAAGNRAVSRLMHPPLAVQRCGPNPCDCSTQERAEHEITSGVKSAVAQRTICEPIYGVHQPSASAATCLLNVNGPTYANELEADRAAGEVTGLTGTGATPAVAPVVSRQAGAGTRPASKNVAAGQNIDPEKWSEALEGQYRSRGDLRRAEAIRICREQGDQACDVVLTQAEVWRLYRLASDAKGDAEKIRNGLSDAAPSLGLLGPMPTSPITGAPSVGAGAAAGGTAAAGISEAAIAATGVGAVIAVCVLAGFQAWKLTKFQIGLMDKGFIILDDPLAICIGGCHVPTAHRGQQQLKDWRTDFASPQIGPNDLPPWLETQPKNRDRRKECQELHPHALTCSEYSDRDETVVEFLMSQGLSHHDLLGCEGVASFAPRSIDACDGAPGERWHCSIQGGGVVSVFACLCCREDGSTSMEWRGPHWSVRLGRRQ